MADQIKHGSQQIVAANSSIDVSALPDSGVTANAYPGGQTTVPSFAVDTKGRVTSASTTAVKMTGIDFGASGNTIVDQTIFVETSAPQSSDGENGDVWYQTIS